MAFAIKNLTLAEPHLRFPIVMLLGAVFALFLLIFISSKLVQLFRPNTDTPTRYAFRFAAFGVAFLVAVFVLVTVLVPQRTEPNSGYPAHNRASNFDEVTGISDQSAADYTSATLVPQTDTDVTVASRDDTFWLPISREMLNKLAGDENSEEIQELTSQIPQQLSHAYAMIPLSQAGPSSAPPVIRQVLSPAAIRYILIPENLKAIVSAVSAYLPAEADAATDDVGTMLAEAASSATETPKLADWVHQKPGIGQTVVTSHFTESTPLAQDALRPEINEALQARITKLCSREFGIDDGWQKLVDVSLSDKAVLASILKTEKTVEIPDTVDGPKMMQQTYALVEFPEVIEQQVLGTVRAELIKSRTVAVSIALLAIWLCGVLLTFAFQASQHGSFMKKLATVPVMAILILPCMLLAVAMIASMAKGDTFELTLGDGRISCVVDASTETE